MTANVWGATRSHMSTHRVPLVHNVPEYASFYGKFTGRATVRGVWDETVDEPVDYPIEEDDAAVRDAACYVSDIHGPVMSAPRWWQVSRATSPFKPDEVPATVTNAETKIEEDKTATEKCSTTSCRLND